MTISLSGIDTLIWDLDGTLVDSAADIAQSVNFVLLSYQLPELTDADVRRMIGHGASKLLQRAFAHVNATDQYNAEQSYQRFLSHYEDNCCNQTTVYQGIQEVLKRFHGMGYKQGVCTNKPEKMARTIVSELFPSDYFAAVVGGDTTDHRKPDPAPLRLSLELLAGDVSTALMIGDSAADVGVARSVNIPVVLLPWGYTDDVHSLGADHVAQDAAALFDIIDKQGGL